MAQTPDVRVRLSAEGVDEVVAAMKRVQDEAKKTDGIKLLQAAFSDLGKELLGGFGIGAAIDGLAELGKSALDNAVSIVHLSEKIGTGVETLSVLSLAARDADVSQEDLGTSLQRLAKNMDLAAQGSAKPLDAFKRLGISMKDIKSNDPGQMFVLLSQKLGAAGGSTKAAALAQDLLGKSGANLLPVMQQLANDGFDNLQAKAQRMGLFLSQDVVDDIKAANDALTDLKNISLGVATQFLSGFAPKAADAMEQFGAAVTSSGVNGMKTLGEYVGYIAKGIVFAFVSIGEIIGAVLGSVAQEAITTFNEVIAVGKGSIAALKALVSGDTAGAKAAFMKGLNSAGDLELQGISTQKDIYSGLGNQLKQNFQNLTAQDSKPIGSGATHKGGGTDTGNSAALAKARLAFLQAQADNELAIDKVKNQLEQQEDDRQYRDGFLALNDYYDRRAALISKETQDELTNLNQKRTNLVNQPTDSPQAAVKKQQEIAALDAKITEVKLENAGKLAANEDERHNATIEHRTQEFQLESKIATAEGDRNKAAQLALEAELSQTEELLTKQGVAADQIKKILDDMRTTGTARNNFDAASRLGSTANTDLDLAKRDIQRQADTGQINYLEAQAKTIALEQDRITTLKAIGAEMTKNAELSKDPSLIDQAKQFNAAVKDIEASTNIVGRAMADLKNTAIQGGINAFSTFVGDAVTGAKSLKDAWADLGKAFQQIVAQMIAKLIELYIIMLITKFINGGSGGVGSGGGNSPDLTSNFDLGNNGSPSFFASGGYTGDAPVNKAAGVVHGKEFVVNAPGTARFRPLLEWMNSGSMRGIAAMPGSYMSGGYVTGQGGSPVAVNIINNTGQEATQTTSTQADGSQVVDVVIGKIAADIAQGGKVGQAMQRTYGIRRPGVNRGRG
jgi:hypothetical protein